ncbi:MAG: GNAT family N-acetyltransferase, partial [Lachnospiraceae bacterium]
EEGHMAWLREQVEPGHVAQFIIGVEAEENRSAAEHWADAEGDGKIFCANGVGGCTGEKHQAGREKACREIGSVYLRDIDREKKKAEYGIFIGEEDALGRGYGVRAAKLMLEYGFNTLHLEKIFLRVLEDNAGARKSYTKAGFQVIENKRESVELEQGVRNVLFMEVRRSTWERTKNNVGAV